jgi:hypothetical protein
MEINSLTSEAWCEKYKIEMVYSEYQHLLFNRDVVSKNALHASNSQERRLQVFSPQKISIEAMYMLISSYVN